MFNHEKLISLFTNFEQGDSLPISEYFFGSDWFNISRLRKGLIAIRETQHLEDVLSFALETDEGIVLIDSGMGLANIRSILDPNKPVFLLLTHSHWDHIGGARDFSQIAIYDHPYETDRLKKGWPLNETVGYEKNFFTIELPPTVDLKKFNIPGLSDFKTFKDLEVLKIFGLEILVIHTPGHTPGSVCFFVNNTGELYTGDTLYSGPEYLHLPESSVSDYLNSLLKIRELLGNKIRRILPGHNSDSENIDLLDAHIQALQGDLEPVKIYRSADEFGSFEEKKYKSFSLMLPIKD